MFLIVKFNLSFEKNTIIGIFSSEKEFLEFGLFENDDDKDDDKDDDDDDDFFEKNNEYYLEITESNKLVNIPLKHDMYKAMGQRNRNYDTFDSWYKEHFVGRTVRELQLNYLNDKKGVENENENEKDE